MKRHRLASMLAAGAAVLSVSVSAMQPTAASAQIGGVVFDPRNYAQNILTAARTLEQINNQIRQLQNQATSLVNEAHNLQSLPLTVLEPLQTGKESLRRLYDFDLMLGGGHLAGWALEGEACLEQVDHSLNALLDQK